MAGYQLSQLQIENQNSRPSARGSTYRKLALSAERLQELAKMQDFIDPAPGAHCLSGTEKR